MDEVNFKYNYYDLMIIILVADLGDSVHSEEESLTGKHSLPSILSEKMSNVNTTIEKQMICTIS